MNFTRDCLAFAWCWIAFHLYVSVPWFWPDAIAFRLLPSVGCYAYSDTWADFRENMRWLHERA